eukprot:842818-Prymnesium_polylepis.1
MDRAGAEKLWREWAAGRLVREFYTPREASLQSVCVTTYVFHTGVLAPGGWGAATLELNVNWALAHGYRFVLFAGAGSGQGAG